MLDATTVRRALSSLGMLRFFPSDPETRAAIGELLLDMCPSDEACDWLVKRTHQLYNEWPGPVGLRAVLCAKYKPADGIEASCTVAYPDGIPPDHAITGQKFPALPPGVVSADGELAGLIAGLSERKALPAPCCDAMTGRTSAGEFCTCPVGEFARQLAEHRARTGEKA